MARASQLITAWKATEPVRLYVYGVGLAVLALLAGYGLVTARTVPLWVGVLTALCLAPAVEAARAKVTPPAGLPDPPTDAVTE